MNFLKKLTDKSKNQPDPPKRQSIINNKQSGKNQPQVPSKRQSIIGNKQSGNNQQQVPLNNEEFNQDDQYEQQYQQEYHNYQEDENYDGQDYNQDEQNYSEEPYFPQKGQFKQPITGKNAKKRSFIELVQDHPIIAALIAMLCLIIVILIIVLPVTLAKPRQERETKPECPDGNSQPRIDCLPDVKRLNAQGRNLGTECRSRKCCWSDSPGNGGPNCAFPYNYGFRKTKVKGDSFTNKWMDLVRLNSPASFTKSDIVNLETKIEMQTDSRMRLRVSEFTFKIRSFSVNKSDYSTHRRIEVYFKRLDLKFLKISSP